MKDPWTREWIRDSAGFRYCSHNLWLCRGQIIQPGVSQVLHFVYLITQNTRGTNDQLNEHIIIFHLSAEAVLLFSETGLKGPNVPRCPELSGDWGVIKFLCFNFQHPWDPLRP